MHVRLQTWFPFTMQICMNGREWLAEDLSKAGVDFVKHDNCFPYIEDVSRAQRLLSKQVKLNWPRVLDGLALQVNPALPSIVQVKRYCQVLWIGADGHATSSLMPSLN